MDVIGAVLLISIVPHSSVCVIRDMASCQTDVTLKLPDGVLPVYTFSWLGFVNYIHMSTGRAHPSKAPRIVLIQREFGLGTARDLVNLPKSYKIGNAIFSNYERDEDDCGITQSQVEMGARCPRAYIEVPVSDVTPHPEYSRFGIENSLAIVKLIRPLSSGYVMPICLPSYTDRKRKRTTRMVYLVDYMSSVPVDMNTENMAKTTLKLYTHRECRTQRLRFSEVYCEGNTFKFVPPAYPELPRIQLAPESRCPLKATMNLLKSFNANQKLLSPKKQIIEESVTHMLCTSGCGVRPGAPIISHALDGFIEVVGLAAGGGGCTDFYMRHQFNPDPPTYIDVYPYNTWIINVITARILPQPQSQNFRLTDSGSYLRADEKDESEDYGRKEGWNGKTFLKGRHCFDRTLTFDHELKKLTSFIYMENFRVITNPYSRMHIIIQISAGVECTIVCAHLVMPNKKITPFVSGIDTFNITVNFSTEWFPHFYGFAITLVGKNTSDEDLKKWLPQRDLSYW